MTTTVESDTTDCKEFANSVGRVLDRLWGEATAAPAADVAGLWDVAAEQVGSNWARKVRWDFCWPRSVNSGDAPARCRSRTPMSPSNYSTVPKLMQSRGA